MFRIKVLLIDDDIGLINSLSSSLEKEHIDIKAVSSGLEAISILDAKSFDVILMEINIKDIDGFEVIRHIRSNKIYTPLIIISQREEEHNQILALGLGADDYIVKPFNHHLLSLKIKAMYRRSNSYSNVDDKILIEGPFKLNNETFQIYKNNEIIDLTSKETMMLKFFLENPNQVFTKEQLYRKLWNNTVIDDNTIMVYIKRLRDKIEDNPKDPKLLKTVWGIGYRLEI